MYQTVSKEQNNANYAKNDVYFKKVFWGLKRHFHKGGKRKKNFQIIKLSNGLLESSYESCNTGFLHLVKKERKTLKNLLFWAKNCQKKSEGKIREN